jgi:hypothetical protein
MYEGRTSHKPLCTLAMALNEDGFLLLRNDPEEHKITDGVVANVLESRVVLVHP